MTFLAPQRAVLPNPFHTCTHFHELAHTVHGTTLQHENVFAPAPTNVTTWKLHKNRACNFGNVSMGVMRLRPCQSERAAPVQFASFWNRSLHFGHGLTFFFGTLFYSVRFYLPSDSALLLCKLAMEANYKEKKKENTVGPK